MVEKISEPEKKTISREDFLAGMRPKPEEFNVDGLGVIKIRAISLSEREEIKSGSTPFGGKVDEAKFAAITLLKGVVDPKLTLQDVAELQGANFGIVNKIGNRIWELSGIKSGAEEVAKNA